tara:strand:+ start:215 stop:376 length:162 start_codon:yes stop_codon:yes gene_type:complete
MYTFDPSAHKICLLQIVPQRCGKQGLCGRPALMRTKRLIGRGWPKLAAARGTI